MHRLRLGMAVGAAVVLVTGLAVAVPAAIAQTSAPGAPGSDATWNEPSDALQQYEKLWNVAATS